MAMEESDAVMQQHIAAEEPAEIVEFEPIEKLETLGINKGDIKKAKDAGFHTCESIVMEAKKNMSSIKGLSDAKLDKMIEAARKISGRGVSFISAKILEEQRELKIVHISTGASQLDELMGGGVETGSLTEIFGEYRCGKTQLAMQLCVNSQINSKIPGKAIYIDTEGSFRPSRIREMAARHNVEGDEILDNITYGRVYNYEQQNQLLDHAAALMSEEQYKVLVVDSLMAVFRTDFSGRGELADRQQKLNQLLNRLRKLADEFNIAVFYTNQVMSDPSGGAMFVSDPKKAVGGHVVAHASTYRLSVRKGKGEQRVVKIVQSPNRAEAEVSFAISNDGIIDFKD